MRYHSHHSRTPQPSGTLGLRLGVSLLLTLLTLAVQRRDPVLLQTVRTQVMANSGEVAEAFSRFTDSLSGGEPVVEAWAELRSDLAQEWARSAAS